MFVTTVRSNRSSDFHPEILGPHAPVGKETPQRRNQEGERRPKAPPSSAPTGVGAGLSPGARSDREARGAARWPHDSVADRIAPPHAAFAATPHAATNAMPATPAAATAPGPPPRLPRPHAAMGGRPRASHRASARPRPRSSPREAAAAAHLHLPQPPLQLRPPTSSRAIQPRHSRVEPPQAGRGHQITAPPPVRSPARSSTSAGRGRPAAADTARNFVRRLPPTAAEGREEVGLGRTRGDRSAPG
jgi:hypothetical protein